MHVLDKQTRTYEKRYEHRIVGFIFAALKLYLIYAAIVLVVFFLLGFLGGLLAVATTPSRAAEPTQEFSWRCAGLNFACSPSAARLPFSPSTIYRIGSIVKAVDDDPLGVRPITDPIVRDEVETMSQVDEDLPSSSTQESDMLKEMLLHSAGIPLEDMVWLSMVGHPEMGFLVIRTTRGDYCACIDRDGNLQGPLHASNYYGFEAVIYEQVP